MLTLGSLKFGPVVSKKKADSVPAAGIGFLVSVVEP
jgi:hypothetical protein